MAFYKIILYAVLLYCTWCPLAVLSDARSLLLKTESYVVEVEVEVVCGLQIVQTVPCFMLAYVLPYHSIKNDHPQIKTRNTDAGISTYSC